MRCLLGLLRLYGPAVRDVPLWATAVGGPFRRTIVKRAVVVYLVVTSACAVGQIHSQTDAVNRVKQVVDALKLDAGHPSQWRVESRSYPDENGVVRLTSWTIVTKYFTFGLQTEGTFSFFSGGSPQSGAAGSALTDEKLWRLAERVNAVLIGPLPQGWRRLSLKNLDQIPRNRHVLEAQGVVELIWRDQHTEPTFAMIRAQIKRSTGRVTSWRAYIPDSYGPSTASLSASQARGRLVSFAEQAMAQHPGARAVIERAMANTAGRAPVLEWWPAGSGYQFKSALRYARIRQLRLVYVWRYGGSECAIDANTGELFRLQDHGPPKSDMSRQGPRVFPAGVIGAGLGAGAGAPAGRRVAP